MPSQQQIGAAYHWVTGSGIPKSTEAIAPTRDIFRARLDRFYRDLMTASWPDAESALLTAVVGEIGNNCFDHNLGQWRDVPGCWFEWGDQQNTRWVLVADRGQGVRESLRRVDSSIQTDQEAIDIAFSKVLSGRSPEKRGNGLKFVRQTINGHPNRGLLFLSGQGQIFFGGLGPSAGRYISDFAAGQKIEGTWALILGEKS